MNPLHEYVEKLRKVADAIETLFPPSSHALENTAAAYNPWYDVLTSGVPAPPRGKKTPAKKLHWTQRPENQARLKRQLKRATRIRLAGKS